MPNGDMRFVVLRKIFMVLKVLTGIGFFLCS